VAGKLNVNVDDLIRGSSELGDQASALSARHRRSMIGLSDAEPGWVATSADALALSCRNPQLGRSAPALKRLVLWPTAVGTMGVVSRYLEHL